MRQQPLIPHEGFDKFARQASCGPSVSPSVQCLMSARTATNNPSPHSTKTSWAPLPSHSLSDTGLSRGVACECTMLVGPTYPPQEGIGSGGPGRGYLINGSLSGVAFTNIRTPVTGSMASLSRRACYKCGELGHHAENCSSPDRLCYNCKSP